MRRSVEDEQRRRHVLHERPRLVPERVVEHEIAHVPRRRGPLVERDGVVDVEAAVAGEPKPEGEVAVLVVTEEALVEPAELDERAAPVERGSRAHGEDLAATALDHHREILVPAPGRATDVEDVAGAVEPVRRLRLDQATAERRVVGTVAGRFQERLEPARLRERVGIHEGDELAVVREPDGAVVRGREARVLLEPQNLDAGMPVLESVHRAIGARVVDDDRPRRLHRLALEGRERTIEKLAAVVVDDHRGDGRHRDSVGRRSSIPAMTTVVAPLPARFARLVKIEHTVFALPFAYVGAFLAVDGVPSAHDLLWITLAMVGARSLAMGLNRLIDARIDARNPRTASRELPSGELSAAQVVLFCLAALALFLVAVWQLEPLVRWLWPIPVVAF